MLSQEDTNMFSFTLSPFQQEACSAIRDGKHCLVTAHTGSGKTVPAEYAILYFTQKNKKVIYTSPIKALSNQKLHDFRNKYPNISFGILTGDIEDNKEAQVLIMTTEILANNLLTRHNTSTLNNTNNHSNPLRFDMDYDNDLAIVIYDEVHYISDPDRGHVWEQSMILLPSHIQMLMLSATIANPETFANWISSITNRELVIASTTERVVPLSHSIYVAPLKKSVMTKIPKNLFGLIEQTTTRFTKIKGNEHSSFDEEAYRNVLITKDYLHKNYIQSNRIYVLMSLLKELKDRQMLPCLIFVFSRKQVESIASSIFETGGVNLFTDDEVASDIQGRIRKECRHILSKRLPNYQEYMELPEYITLSSLLEKGIAIHHAGVLPVFRELVEILDEKGYIKVLLATETFAVGVNMPTKTVVFTNIYKYTNGQHRILLPHEYTQMAGRAGRRGLDTVGYSIICADLFDTPLSHTMKQMLSGTPLQIESHFKPSYHIILNAIEHNKHSEDTLLDSIISLTNKSLHAPSVIKSLDILITKIANKTQELSQLEKSFELTMQTDKKAFDEYVELKEKIKAGMLTNKRLKALQRSIDGYQNDNRHIETEYERYETINIHRKRLTDLENEKESIENHIIQDISVILSLLESGGFVSKISSENKYELTKKGLIALNLHEVHPIALANFLEYKNYYVSYEDGNESALSILQVISSLCQINSMPPFELSQKPSKDVLMLSKMYEDAYEDEIKHCNRYLIQEMDVMLYCPQLFEQWALATTAEECKMVLATAKEEYDISSLGDFVKGILKTIKIAKEIQSICVNLEMHTLSEILSRIPSLLMKHVATNQSLYI